MNKERKNYIVCVISAYAYINNHINYGSLLQYYALQTILEELGYSSYWLRYIIKDENNVKSKLKKIIKLCMAPRYEWQVQRKLKTFKNFSELNLNLSKEIYSSIDQLNKNVPNADAYITGSDQVWGGVEEANYLTFVPDNKKKISYAASFGKNKISEEHFNTVKPWINRLDYISVREKSGINICKEMGVKADLVLDPTLLIDINRYPKKNIDDINKEKYIFGYFLNLKNKNDLPIDIIYEYSKKEKSRLIITGGVQGIKGTFKSKYMEYLSPEEWLARYSNAHSIITNTFHGTVFAIMNHKPFIVFLQNGNTKKQNERIFSLLECFKLKNRIFKKDVLLTKQMEEEIDWNEVEKIRELKRKQSIEFIKQALL